MDIADKVEAALKTSVRPSVIARGGEIRVVRVEDDTAVLEVTGSPGAALPLVGRIEALIRQAVPGIAKVRMVGPAASAATAASGDGGIADLIRDVLERDINPLIAAHRGHATLVGVEDGRVQIRLEGGCQGCSLAEVTLRQGIEPVLRSKVAGVVGLTDVTDHEAGREPFYSAAKR
ncbi:MAG TPA: NifU family protein [Reyranella sp.]|nr:NifU family protein [Reyranella sp.]